MPSYDANDVDCRVTVSPEGMMSSMGHIVDLRVMTLTLEVKDDDAITGEFDADSLQVVSEGPKPKDREEIKKNSDKTLEVNKYPKFRFRSTSVQRDGDQARIEGDLTLHGKTNSVSVVASNDGKHWNAEVTLSQSDFGITPYSKFGMLKVKDQVKVTISVPSS